MTHVKVRERPSPRMRSPTDEPPESVRTNGQVRLRL
jgi:hypothetical protein